MLIAGNTNRVNLAGPTGRQWLVNNSTAKSQQKYAYFKTLLEASNPRESFTTNSINSFTGATPAKTYPNGDTNQVYYHNGNLTITSLNVTNGEKRTLLVENGNIAISGNITVQPGGFLAIITTGNIIFGGNVTNVQGIYIANGTLTINNANSSLTGLARQFVGQGVFVGWSGVSINRNLNLASDDLYNNTNPAAKFIYRPDFIINAPISFKHSSIKWTEVAPNSF